MESIIPCAAPKAWCKEKREVPSVRIPSLYSSAAAWTPAVVVGILIQNRSLNRTISLSPSLGWERSALRNSLLVVGVSVSSSVVDDGLFVVCVARRDLSEDSTLDGGNDEFVESSGLHSYQP